MKRPRLAKRIASAALAVILLGMAAWMLWVLDPTRSAIFVADSPGGMYRCAVFDGDPLGGSPAYSAGLFRRHWPHWELPGQRAQWNGDSAFTSWGFRPTWYPKGVEIEFETGSGRRAVISGRDVGGKQEWNGP